MQCCCARWFQILPSRSTSWMKRFAYPPVHTYCDILTIKSGKQIVFRKRCDEHKYNSIWIYGCCLLWCACFDDFHYTWRPRRRFKTVSSELLYFAFHFIWRMFSVAKIISWQSLDDDGGDCSNNWNHFYFTQYTIYFTLCEIDDRLGSSSYRCRETAPYRNASIPSLSLQHDYDLICTLSSYTI